MFTRIESWLSMCHNLVFILQANIFEDVEAAAWIEVTVVTFIFGCWIATSSAELEWTVWAYLVEAFRIILIPYKTVTYRTVLIPILRCQKVHLEVIYLLVIQVAALYVHIRLAFLACKLRDSSVLHLQNGITVGSDTPLVSLTTADLAMSLQLINPMHLALVQNVFKVLLRQWLVALRTPKLRLLLL